MPGKKKELTYSSKNVRVCISKHCSRLLYPEMRSRFYTVPLTEESLRRTASHELIFQKLKKRVTVPGVILWEYQYIFLAQKRWHPHPRALNLILCSNETFPVVYDDAVCTSGNLPAPLLCFRHQISDACS